MKWTKSILFLILLFAVYKFAVAGGPDLVVKIVKDELVTSKKCVLGVMKEGSFKSMDEKFIIISYDLYVLNYRGETKWFKSMEKPNVDLSDVDGLEIVKGDLIVIENAVVVNRRNGEATKLGRITERYLVR